MFSPLPVCVCVECDNQGMLTSCMCVGCDSEGVLTSCLCVGCDSEGVLTSSVCVGCDFQIITMVKTLREDQGVAASVLTLFFIS